MNWRTLRVAALLVSLAATSHPAAAAEDFAAWLLALRQEAATAGIRPQTLDAALTGVQPIPRVIELDQRQPEGTITFARYLERVVTPKRIQKAKALYAENRALLDPIGKEFGVQPRFIVALWGMETDFGRNMGGFRVVDSLVTLAHEGRRGAYFRKELMAALRILDAGHVTPDRMIGSWAGAMGQCQFMPSSFEKYAVDRDGDGRRDIWGTRADVFASAATYLSTVGWDPTRTWGREVKVSADALTANQKDPGKQRSLIDWNRLGVRRIGGGGLPHQDVAATLVMPDGPTGRAFLVYSNYQTVLNWNRSTYFATAVGLLSDNIGDGH